MKKDIMIKAHDGGEFSAFVCYPATDLPAPAIVVAQEIFGVNENMRKVAEHLSQAGYVTICPDLFWRQEAGVQLSDQTEAGWKRAFELFSGFDVDLGVEDLKSTLAHVRGDPQCSGKAGAIGFCLGGKLAYLMAARSDVECSVAYYGVGIEDYLDEAENIKKPLLMHVAEKDKFVPLEAQEKIMQALKKHKNVEVDVYPGVNHAFARVGGEHYDKEAAQRANYSTADFLAARLSGRKNK